MSTRYMQGACMPSASAPAQLQESSAARMVSTAKSRTTWSFDAKASKAGGRMS